MVLVAMVVGVLLVVVVTVVGAVVRDVVTEVVVGVAVVVSVVVVGVVVVAADADVETSVLPVPTLCLLWNMPSMMGFAEAVVDATRARRARAFWASSSMILVLPAGRSPEMSFSTGLSQSCNKRLLGVAVVI